MAQAPKTSHRIWPKEIAGGVIFIAVVIVIGLIIKLESHPSPKTTTAAAKISATPDSYNDCIGTVTDIHDQTIAVTFNGTSGSGQPFTKIFQVTVNDKTEINTLSTTTSQRVLTPAKFSDIKIGQTVFVAAEENIAPVTEFTASKVNIYLTS